jgi:diguanylate cyclase (GGDEF)-like protein/PAS domain S-box-containing protein
LSQALAVLPRAVIAECVAVGVIALAGWFVRRDRTDALLATALGLLGASALLGGLGGLSPLTSRPLGYLALLAFLASGWCILQLRHAFAPYSPSTMLLARSGLVAVVLVDTLVALLAAVASDASHLGWLDAVAGSTTAAAWALCVIEPALRFWMASRGRPPVQQARLQALSAGCLCLVCVWLLGLLAAFLQLPVALVATDAAVLLVVPLLYVSLEPPQWLRRVWRGSEERALQRAMDALLIYSPDRRTLARRGLEWAMRLVGAEAGVITTQEGDVLAAYNRRPAGSIDLERRRNVIAVDMPVGEETATLTVEAGPFSPFFGGEEFERLRSYAHSLALALDRLRLEDEALLRTAQHEAVLHAIDEMGEGLLVKQNGKVIYANDAYFRITGLSTMEVGQAPATPNGALAPGSADRSRRRLAAASNRRETEVINGVGHRVFVESSVCDVSVGSGDMSVALLRDISERKKAERAVLDQARMLDLSHDAIFMRALVPPVITYWSQGAEKAYGYTADEALGKDPHKLLLSVFQRPLHEIEEDTLRRGEWDGEVVQQRSDGSTRIMASRWSLRLNDEGAPDGILEVNRDVTEKRRTERVRSLQATVTRALSESSGTAEAAVDMLEALCAALDYQIGELWLMDSTDETLTLRHSWHSADIDGPVFEQGARRLALHRGQDLAGRAWEEERPVSVRELADDQGCLRRGLAAVLGLKAGAAIPVAVEQRSLGAIAIYSRAPRVLDPELLQALEDLGRQIGGYFERKRTETALEESVERLEQLAATDPLTGLFNRRAFEQALADLSGQPFALLSVDVDQLKPINDEYGHEAGDVVLQTVAKALQSLVRDNDLVARMGGDEFAVLLPAAGPTEAAGVGERMRAAMHRISVPYGRARISVGWVAAPAGADPSMVRRASDEVLHRAKSMGRDRVEGETFEVSIVPQRFGAHEAELISSVLSSEHINAVFQPIVDLDSGAIIGYEALARPAGHEPTSSVEALFMAARRLGRIRDLDWLCRRAAVRSARFLPGAPSLFLNVSAVAFLDPVHPVDQLLLLLRWAGWPPDRTVLEITEQEAVRDLSRARLVVAAYREHGVRFALDDVGEGHSTLELLAATNPEFIKMAASLTGAMADAGPFSAVQATIAFAKSSRAQVIAEGIETQEAVDKMRELGVPLGQGFLLGRPAPAEEFARAVPTVQLRKRRPRRTSRNRGADAG